MTVAVAFGTFTEESCRRIVYVAPYFNNLAVLASSGIFILRTWAVWNKSQAILIFLFLVLIVQAVATLTISYYIVPLLGFGGLSCIPQLDPNHPFYNMFYVCNMAFDAIILVLTIYRLAFRLGVIAKTPLVQQLLRDGALYFAVVFFGNTLNVAFFAHKTWQYSALNAELSLVLTVIMATRMVLNSQEFQESYHSTAELPHGDRWKSPYSGQRGPTSLYPSFDTSHSGNHSRGNSLRGDTFTMPKIPSNRAFVHQQPLQIVVERSQTSDRMGAINDGQNLNEWSSTESVRRPQYTV